MKFIFLSFSFLLFAMPSLTAFAEVPIDGGSEQVAKDNMSTLQSVIYMIYEVPPAKKSCSASLVAKNIILTAAHCTKGLAKGSIITLNNVANFKIVDLTAILPDVPSSDLALIKVAGPAEKTFLDDLPFLSIAAPTQVEELLSTASRVLISGYGLQNMKDIKLHNNTVGTLLAGYANPMPQARKTELKVTDAEIVFTAIRSSRTVIKNAAGETFDGLSFNYSKKYAVEGSLGLPGDSGSPAIVFDHNKKPWIIGVASRFGSVSKPVVKVSAQREQDDEATPIAFNPKLSVQTYLDQYLSELRRLRFVGKRDVNKTNFDIFIDSSGEYVNDYTSVMDQANSDFILNSIAALK